MNAIVGVDIGTQGTKAAIFDAASGRCLAHAFEPSRLHRPKAGVVEEDPRRQFESVCRTIRTCVKQSRIDGRHVAAIGIAGQMAGVIGVGKDGRSVTPYDSWLDTRCAPYIKVMERDAGDEIVGKTGCPASFNHGPKKLWWKHERPAVYKRIAAFVQPAGFAAMQLCGLDAAGAFIDHSYLHFTGFADNLARQWDEALCRRFGIDVAKLPRIVQPQDIVGTLPRKSATACGLRIDTPVVAGCGDTAASFLSCGATREGICVDVAGTASVFAATTGAFRPDHAERVLGVGRSAVPGLWHPYAYINGGGMNLEWFRKEILNHGRRGKHELSFEALNKVAAAVSTHDDNAMFIPHLGGRVSPPQPQLRGAWVGLSWDAGVGALYRAVLEAVALEYAIYRRVLLSLYGKLKLRELRITGGGERSALWNQIKADALQTSVTRIAESHGAPMGAALIAGFGVGAIRSLPDAANRWIALGQTVRPNRKMAVHYDRRRAAYERLLKVLDGTLT